MDKLTTVWNKKTGEKGWKFKGIIFSFYDETETPETILLNPILFWLDQQGDEYINSLAHAMVDEDEKIIYLFFKEESQRLVGAVPRGYTLEYFEQFPYGADTTGKLWRNYFRNHWTEKKPLDWGEHKNVWGNDLNRKDIWSL